jgi:FtsP/CotA-like multicopper oxidase with cupredoxin domain
MTDVARTPRLNRRALLKVSGAGALALAGAGGLAPNLLSRARAAGGPPAIHPDINKVFALAGTDGWVHLQGAPLMEGSSSVFPDPLGDDQNMYNYGFRDASRWQRILDGEADQESAAAREAREAIFGWKGETQNASPLLWVDEGDRVQIVLYNLGWQVRPDIPDGHTIHWHGFRNAIPWFDGVPEMAAGAPIGKTLTYFYNPVDPGTYMYHCHWEDVEHIQMGMTGIVFVRPRQNTTGFNAANAVPWYAPRAGEEYVFNDGNGASAYDRQFAMLLMDYNLFQHWQLAHIQQPDWSQYTPTAWVMNGRSYPDTVLPDGVTTVGIEQDPPIHTGTASGGADRALSAPGLPPGLAGRILALSAGPGAGQRRLIVASTATEITVAEPWDTYLGLPAAGTAFRVHDADPRLRYQPQSSLVTCEPGDRVLLRVANLGYQQHAMALEGIDMLVVGRDSTFMGDRLERTGTIDVAPGQAYDVIFTAPPHGGGAEPDVYLFADRNFSNDATGPEAGFGGMATEVHVYPAGSLRRQAVPNDNGL